MPSQPLERITVSPNGRFLVTESGKPFFWLGDTAWEIFHRLKREEVEHYLENRRQRGFNVIQSVALAEFDGLCTPNAYGTIPLAGDDPTRPNEFYFRHVDEIIRMAASKGIYIGLLPTWGDKVYSPGWGVGPLVFNPENAQAYGRFLGQRYRNDTNLIWILGGDRPATGCEPVWEAMVAGIIEGLGRKPLFSYHPPGGAGSSAYFHEADWLGVNMWQSGHSQLDSPVWEMIASDYNRQPIKPVLDGEPNYEDHPIDPWSRKWVAEYGRFTDYDVRKQAYRSVFAGACGHTYGHHSIWQFWTLQREPVNFPMPTWDEAILRPGGSQLIHLKNLILSRPYFTRVPDQGLLVYKKNQDTEASTVSVATRDENGRYAFIYVPKPEQTVEINLGGLKGPLRVCWFDPREGRSITVGEVKALGIQSFTSPVAGPDWVLVLDSVGENYPLPGK